MNSKGQIIPLYHGKIPGSKIIANRESSEIIEDGVLILHKISVPTIEIFLPEDGTSNGTAVIICPGGGYSISAYKHEGTDVAKLFNEWGITAFVLKYRIPDDSSMENKSTGPLQDVQEAIKYIRDHAEKYKISVSKIGVMGFSAGGHLAASSGTHFNKSILNYPSSIDLRPDFLILVYPVISFTNSFGHIGSRDNLLGKNPPPSEVDYYSNELQVSDATPPSFLVHAGDDSAVPVKNSIAFYEALQRHKIQSSLNVYQGGGHGFGLNNPTTADRWSDRLRFWLRENKWIK